MDNQRIGANAYIPKYPLNRGENQKIRAKLFDFGTIKSAETIYRSNNQKIGKKRHGGN